MQKVPSFIFSALSDIKILKTISCEITVKEAFKSR